MNSYRKTGVFMVRLVGYGMALLGALGVVYIVAASFANFEGFTSAPRGESLTSVMWLLTGGALLLLAKPAGRRLGKGLD